MAPTMVLKVAEQVAYKYSKKSPKFGSIWEDTNSFADQKLEEWDASTVVVFAGANSFVYCKIKISSTHIDEIRGMILIR